MKLTRLYSLGLIALAALSVSTPRALAHNEAKYTNIPFVVPGYCGAGVSSRFVSINRAMVLQVVANPSAFSGWEIFNSVPASNTTRPSPTTGLIPAGNYSFTLSGLPSGGEIFVDAISTTGALTPAGTVSANGLANVNVTSPVAGLAAVQFFVATTGTATVLVSNFRINNATVLSDTTQSDTTSTVSPVFFGFCTP